MCAMPKNYMTNINVVPSKIGPARRLEILDDIAKDGPCLPKSVHIEDMDQAFIDFVGADTGFGISLDGKKVPVIFLTIQRWTEFTKTWQFTDEYKNIEFPFITIVRKPDIQQGQNQAGLWNIPGNRTYTYMKVATWDGVRKGVDLYKVPQPTPVDITYEVRLFTNRMKDLNRYNTIIEKAFQSRQCYMVVNGHPMPLHLEVIGDESNIDDFENRRFYIQMFEIKLLGYILDEKDFEVMPAINRIITTLEVVENRLTNTIMFEPLRNGNDITYKFIWLPKSPVEFSFIAPYNASFTGLINITNLNRITIEVGGITVFDGTVFGTPINFTSGDEITISVDKNLTATGSFTLIGITT